MTRASNTISPSAEEQQADAPAGRVINMRDIRRTLMRHWKVLAAFCVVGFFGGMYSLYHTPRVYSVQMVVTPVNATSSNVSSQISGLASLAGVNLQGSSNLNQFQLYLEDLNSREVADALARDDDYMHTLFAYEWDAKTQSWREPRVGLVTSIKMAILSGLGYPVHKWHPPDGLSVQGFLNRDLTVYQEPRHPFIATISLRTSNIPLAEMTLRKINKLADDHLRQEALARTSKYISYLTNQLQTVTLAGQRDAITTTLSDQEKYAMMANAGDSYAAQVFDRPSTTAFPVSPRPTAVYLSWIVLCWVLGAILILAGHYYPGPFERMRDAVLRRARIGRLPRARQRTRQSSL